MIRALILGCLFVLGAVDAAFTCNNQDGSYPKSVCYDIDCTNAIVSHIKHEFDAAFTYMYMGAVFGQYTKARPGLTKFLMESASEERSHAIQMLDYLTVRGIPYTESYTYNLDTVLVPRNGIRAPSTVRTTLEKFLTADATALKDITRTALTEATKLEMVVTKKINDVVTACASDYHAADVFTNPILDEQHHGLRKLQGAVKIFDDMRKGYVTDEELLVVDYLFDLKMLKGEVL